MTLKLAMNTGSMGIDYLDKCLSTFYNLLMHAFPFTGF
jgi:hypothetical protein